MNSSFYDVKTRQKVEAMVTEKVTYLANGQTKFAFKAKTSDGRNLTKFVSKSDYESAQI